jgi:hypothetical protein
MKKTTSTYIGRLQGIRGHISITRSLISYVILKEQTISNAIDLMLVLDVLGWATAELTAAPFGIDLLLRRKSL